MNNKDTIAIAVDHGGWHLKEILKPFLKDLGYEYADLGASSEKAVDYPDFALALAEAVRVGKYKKGVLICGTGLGMSMSANKVPGIRAALCNDVFTAKMSREHNDANVLAIGGRVVEEELAKEIVKVWLRTKFSNAPRHKQRIKKIKEIESKYMSFGSDLSDPYKK